MPPAATTALPLLESWPADPAGRAAALRRVAKGEVRLGRGALADLESAGAAGVLEHLAIDVAAALAVAPSDRALYVAASSWQRRDPRALNRAFTVPGFAERIIAYGVVLLSGAQGDPATAWSPAGRAILGDARAWRLFRTSMALRLDEARLVDAVETASAPWARRFYALEIMAGEFGRSEALNLLDLASRLGGWTQRLRARGALAGARTRRARNLAAEAPIESPPVVPLARLDTRDGST
jgi:hypothetical protein